MTALTASYIWRAAGPALRVLRRCWADVEDIDYVRAQCNSENDTEIGLCRIHYRAIFGREPRDDDAPMRSYPPAGRL